MRVMSASMVCRARRVIPVLFKDTAGSSCGALLPTGNSLDLIDGVEVTCIDNGMPVVIMRAADLGISGTETREALDGDEVLKAKLESIRLKAGPKMNLGDVAAKTVPKMTLVSAPQVGGVVATRTFIPHRCHASIGVLGAVSVATACAIPGTPVASLAQLPEGRSKRMPIEHPIGASTIVVEMDESGEVAGAAVLLTARKLFDGLVFANLADRFV
jgi:4-oxalomesaconate tautomerase